jgi:CHAD domain-containing protein
MTSLQRRGRLREAGEAGARKPFEAWAPGAWERQVDRFLSRAGSVAVGDDVAQLHDLRLDAKKLRYVLEILASSLPARVRTVGYPALVEVQDRLGRLCDHWLAACVVQDTAPLLEPSDTAVSVERLVSIEHDSAERARREFFSWWTVGQWAALRSALAGS